MNDSNADINELVSKVDQLLESLEAERKGKSGPVNFIFEYLSWYIKARRIVAVEQPEMLSEFDSLYKESNCSTLTEATYCIRDYILLTNPPRDPRILFQRWFNKFHPTYIRTYQQKQILLSCCEH